MSHVTDLIPDFLSFWEQARDRPRAEQQHLWYECYEGPHRELFALTDGRHGNPEHLPSALARFPAMSQALPGVAAQIQTTIASITPALCSLFALPHLDLRWVLMVGMFWADGWVVAIDGIPTCFIAVEHLVHASHPRRSLLLAHEAAHVAHAASLGQGWDALKTIGHHLFLEGLATVASAQVVPGHEPATYTWLGLTHTMRGLSMEEWTAQCEAECPHERAKLTEHLFTDDQAMLQRYFLQAPPGVPERLGYLVGWQMFSGLMRQHPMAELSRWSPDQIDEHLRSAAAPG